MAYSTIPKSSIYFNNVLWTGTGSEKTISGVGHQPDWTWIKRREVKDHNVYDPVRGATKLIYPNDASGQDTDAQSLKSWNADGFVLGTATNVNASGGTYVAWNWKANGQGSSNTDGTINTTYTSVSTTSGFSISSYTGTGSAGTVGHGLGAVPKMILIKKLDSGNTGWVVYNHIIGAGKYLRLNTSDAGASDTNIFNNTTPTSSVFSLGTDADNNGSGSSYVAYCFADVQGFSSMGSYTGNGNTDGPFIYTGFKPALVIVKKATGSAVNWVMTDNKFSYNGRGTHDSYVMFPSTNAAETDSYGLLLQSNGFTFKGSDSSSGTVNNNNSTYIYMAFAEAPLVGSNNVPCTAK